MHLFHASPSFQPRASWFVAVLGIHPQASPPPRAAEAPRSTHCFDSVGSGWITRRATGLGVTREQHGYMEGGRRSFDRSNAMPSHSTSQMQVLNRQRPFENSSVS